MNNYYKIANFILFQIGWFATVFAAANQMMSFSLLGIAFVLGLHFLLVKDRKQEILLLFSAALIGLTIDTFNFQIGIFNDSNHSSIAPLWLVGLWMLFASTLNHSMNWLNGKFVLAMIFGAIGAPLAYYSGSVLGALQLNDNLEVSLMVIGFEWAIATPGLLWINQKLAATDQPLSLEQSVI